MTHIDIYYPGIMYLPDEKRGTLEWHGSQKERFEQEVIRLMLPVLEEYYTEEEILGVEFGFHLAGSRNVVVAGQEIDDNAVFRHHVYRVLEEATAALRRPAAALPPIKGLRDLLRNFDSLVSHETERFPLVTMALAETYLHVEGFGRETTGADLGIAVKTITGEAVELLERTMREPDAHSQANAIAAAYLLLAVWKTYPEAAELIASSEPRFRTVAGTTG